MLRETVYILGIPYRATVALQSKQLTLSDLFGIWLKMELHLQKCTESTTFKTNLPKELHKAVINRRGNLFNNPFMICAIFLDPRYRNQIINDENKVLEAKKTLRNLWYRINDNTSQIENKNKSASSADSFDFSFDEQAALDNFLLARTSQINTNHNQTVESMTTNQNINIDILLDQFDPDVLPSLESILNYWESVKNEHPELYELSNYAIPPTEVSIERDFSSLGYVFNDRRCRLAHERLEDIMILNLNPDLFYEVKKDELEELKKKCLKISIKFETKKMSY